MRKVTIIGAGQSGLMIGCGLVQKGYDVTIVSDRTAEEIYNGRIMSSQGMFWDAIANEASLGLRFWEDEAPAMEKIEFNVLSEDGQIALSFCRKPPARVESIDQRVKMPKWMDHFEALGGNLVIQQADVAALEGYAETSDLVLLATGKGELGRLFERDDEKSPYDRPMRALALAYVTGMEPVTPHTGGESFRGLTWNGYPGVGEYFNCNALTKSGPCEIMIYEGIPGGPMDCWDDVETPEEHLAKSKWILEEFFPWEAARCANVQLTDDLAVLKGRFPPTVRKPVATLPSGRIVMGIGDAVCLNDPLTGQGANNANKFGYVMYESILAHGERAFDREWMQGAFDKYWNKARHVVKWTNSMLVPPTDASMQVLAAASQQDMIADHMVSAMNDAEVLEPWFYDAAEAQNFVRANSVHA